MRYSSIQTFLIRYRLYLIIVYRIHVFYFSLSLFLSVSLCLLLSFVLFLYFFTFFLFISNIIHSNIHVLLCFCSLHATLFSLDLKQHASQHYHCYSFPIYLILAYKQFIQPNISELQQTTNSKNTLKQIE